MRRADREVVGTENILSVLDGCDVIRIGLSVDDRAYIVPMNFAFETLNETVYIYLHCAREGRKLDMIARNNNVCFEADSSYRTVKAENACDWGAEYRSVMGEGIIGILHDEEERIHALDMLMRRYGYDGVPRYNSRSLAAVTVLRISVTSITGKQNTGIKRSDEK